MNNKKLEFTFTKVKLNNSIPKDFKFWIELPITWDALTELYYDEFLKWWHRMGYNATFDINQETEQSKLYFQEWLLNHKNKRDKK